MADTETMHRIAIVNPDKCKPPKCAQECKRLCPVNKTGKQCVVVTKREKMSYISEDMCVGCGICIKQCPFEAIKIINLPKNLERDTTHRYGANTFKLHRLPTPRPGQVLGLVGTNGIGKSTALKILSGRQVPNLGNYTSPPQWEEVIHHFRGSELQNFFTKLTSENLMSAIKPQHVDAIPKAARGTVGSILEAKDQTGNRQFFLDHLDLNVVLDRNVQKLSGGELQRFAIAVTCVQNAQVFMFDEPSSYLDVKQRLNMAKAIRSMISMENYVILVEHDLAILDYLSDYICCLYGQATAFGVVTAPFGVREGINIYLDGFIPTENMRFREESLVFRISESAEEELVAERTAHYQYPAFSKTFEGFAINVEAGNFSNAEIICMLGENATGKSTMIKILAGKESPDEGCEDLPSLGMSYKPQVISARFKGTVRQLLHTKIRDIYMSPSFTTDVTRPLHLDDIIDLNVQQLSGGEMQRVGLILALGMPAEVYLIDEPSAYLDVEQRMAAAKAIKRYIINNKKTAFIVEHDFIMATYLADRVIVFEGEPSRQCLATTPQDIVSGFNRFLASLEITFRRDPNNLRPRINKFDSAKDREQKASGHYFFIGD